MDYIRRILPAYFFFVAHLLTMMSSTLGEVSFIVQPTKNTALENEDITFYCIISDLSPTDEVLWYRSGIQISQDAQILGTVQDSHRLIIETDQERGHYNLMIHKVTLADDTEYYCAVRDSTTQIIQLTSETARLEVHRVPPPMYPRCFPLTKDTFASGESVVVICQSERGNPPVSLIWKQGGVVRPIQPDDSEPGYRNIIYNFTVGPENDGDVLQCLLTTSASETTHRSCSLGPLSVVYAPPGAVARTPTADMAPGEDIELSCEADANPLPLYTWSFSANIDPSRLQYLDDGKKLIITPVSGDNGTAINCSATNEHGTAQSPSVILNFKSKDVVPTYATTRSKTVPAGGDTTSTQPGTKPKTNNSSSSNNIILKPEVLAIIASTLTLILLVLVLLVIVTCRCRSGSPKTATQLPHTIYGQYGPTSVQGWEQGSIYFEPRDRISVGDMPTWQRPAPWHRNVAVQVPWVEEPPYEEIGQNWDEGMTLEI